MLENTKKFTKTVESWILSEGHILLTLGSKLGTLWLVDLFIFLNITDDTKEILFMQVTYINFAM